MKYFFGFLPLLLLLSTRSCDQRVETPDGPVYSLNDTLLLTQGQKMTIANEKLNFTFFKMSDSRCPKTVNCVVAGKAKISLAVDQAPSLDTVSLNIKGLCRNREGACGSSAESFGYRFKALTADPYPVAPGQAKAEAATLRLIVSKVK